MEISIDFFPADTLITPPQWHFSIVVAQQQSNE
jgi:hypothetical protein